MGTKQGINFSQQPSDEEFARLREHIARLDAERAELDDQLNGYVEWLVGVVKHNPNAIRRALGMVDMPPRNVCSVCLLNPCGCERRGVIG